MVFVCLRWSYSSLALKPLNIMMIHAAQPRQSLNIHQTWTHFEKPLGICPHGQAMWCEFWVCWKYLSCSLQWRHNERDGVSSHSLTIVYSTVYSGADQRKHQNSVSLAFVRGIHLWQVNSPHKGPVMRKMFQFDNVIMITNQWVEEEVPRWVDACPSHCWLHLALAPPI